MKNIFITNVLGPVTPGIIKSLAESTRALGGEWLSSKVIKLDGQFSALMKVAVESESEVILKSQLESEFTELQFFYAQASQDNRQALNKIELTFDCNDRPGLTREIDDTLSNMGLNVERIECNRFHVSSLGRTVFSSKLAVAIPEDVSSKTVVELLEALGEDVRVNLV